MKQKFFSVVVVMIVLSLFFACSKKEAELEEVISFKAAEESGSISDAPDEVETMEEAQETAPEAPPVVDVTAPAEVRNLIASSGDRSVILSWTNPSEEDFSKVVITYGVDGVVSVRGNPSGTSKQFITDLRNGTEYTFTVMSVDRAGNVSEGIQISSVPENPEPAKIVELPPVKEEPVKVAELPAPAPVETPAPVPAPAPEPEPVKVTESPEPVVEEEVVAEIIPEPVEITESPEPAPATDLEPVDTALVEEPEPVLEPLEKENPAPAIQFIRSADGNIASDFETVFDKTSEVSVLAKASAVELNGEKTLMSAYRMGKYPVTQELFQAVMGVNPSKCVDSSTLYITAEGEVTKLKPCDKISWYDAIAFCNKLSLLFEYEPCYTVNGVDDWNALIYEDIPVEYNADWSDASCDFTRNGFRLPTEREWEFAARGANPEAADWEYTFSGKASEAREAVNADLDSVGWYRYNICAGGVSSETEPAFGAGYGTHEVGLKEPNSLSIYDMCGNVWEWCWDSCDTTDDNSTFAIDPLEGIPEDSCRALRGGSWGIDATCCDIPSRLVEYESYRSTRYGFRLVRTAGVE
ncbi:MAG: SUMF1/EgtB/PvdO family nonheme iron enzyme [Treponemataceae bacterium]|nr:SUMF1/EgtB/PvdO family nonheme iron enzyme [Treponemataceae bacterium]